MPNVTPDSVGAGVSHVYANSANWAHTIGASATCLVVGVVVIDSNNGDGPSAYSPRTCKVGTTTLTSLGFREIGIVGYGLGWAEMFGVMNPPTGPQTIVYTATPLNKGVLDIGGADSVAYINVASLGSVVGTLGYSATPSIGPVSSAVGNRVVGVLGGQANYIFNTPSGTSRFVTTAATSYPGVMIEDASGAASVTLTAGTTDPSMVWGGVAVNLVAKVGTAWTVNSSLAVTATPDVTFTQKTPHQTADTSLAVTAATSVIFQELKGPQSRLVLQYQGPPPAHSGDVVTQNYIGSLLPNMNITQDQINSLIASGFSSYATTTYLTNALSPLASQDYVQSGNATKIPLAQVNNANGVPGLGAGGRIALDRFPSQPSTQRWTQSPWSPSSYGTLPHTATTETNLYSLTVAPSFTGNYKLLVTGLLQAGISADGVGYPLIRVRQGNSTTGQIVAIGRGVAEHYPTLPGLPTTDVDVVSINNDPNLPPIGNSYADISDHITAPASQPTTFSATADVYGTCTVHIRIISNTGVVVATQSATINDADIVTIPETVFSAVGGQSYGLQGYVTSAQGSCYWYGGTFEMSASASGANVGEVNILPQPLNTQNSITGSTTVYVNALRSGSSGTVTVSSFQPKLSVLAIPA